MIYFEQYWRGYVLDLDDTMKERLEMMLESQIGGVLAKIDEEMAAKADRQSFGSKSSQQWELFISKCIKAQGLF